MTDTFTQILFIVSGVLVVWVLVLTYQLWSLKRRYKGVTDALKEGNLADVVVRFTEELKYLQNKNKSLEEVQAKTAETLRGAFQKADVVRYDAFDDIGGKLSYSIALLNDKGDGIILTTINGRQESRSYAKPVKGGKSSYNLSEEEEQAINKALKGH